MALDQANFKSLSGPGNSKNGGQAHVCHSPADSTTTMSGSGYFDAVASQLNVRDFLMIVGTDGPTVISVAAITNGVVTTTAQA